MPDFLSAGLNQIATLWHRTGTSGFGQPTFSDPQIIRCRWEERTQFIRTPDGVEIPSRATVFTEVDVHTGDFLMLGESNESNPQPLQRAYKVIDARKIPGVFAEAFERRAYL